jgi:hypothetical protein
MLTNQFAAVAAHGAGTDGAKEPRVRPAPGTLPPEAVAHAPLVRAATRRLAAGRATDLPALALEQTLAASPLAVAAASL